MPLKHESPIKGLMSVRNNDNNNDNYPIRMAPFA